MSVERLRVSFALKNKGVASFFKYEMGMWGGGGKFKVPTQTHVIDKKIIENAYVYGRDLIFQISLNILLVHQTFCP